MTLFSKQNQPQVFKATLSLAERRRIMHVIQQWTDNMGSGTRFDQFLVEMEQKLVGEYGGLYEPLYDAAKVGDNAVINHFALCHDPQALDFIELAFRTNGGIGKQQTVDAINKIFLECGIGYELTSYVDTISEPGVDSQGRTTPRQLSTEYPRIIERGQQFLHTEATQPALDMLTDSRFATANQEFLDALEYFRKGDNKACLNECLKAFESTMKIICHHKQWQVDKDATASKLVNVCLDNQLVPTFSETQLNSLSGLLKTTIPTARNKQSGHGQGVQPVTVTDAMAKFALNSTASTIVLLIESAQL